MNVISRCLELPMPNFQSRIRRNICRFFVFCCWSVVFVASLSPRPIQPLFLDSLLWIIRHAAGYFHTARKKERSKEEEERHVDYTPEKDGSQRDTHFGPSSLSHSSCEYFSIVWLFLFETTRFSYRRLGWTRWSFFNRTTRIHACVLCDSKKKKKLGKILKMKL